MILSKHKTFSLNQAITATGISENVIEFPANGTPPYETAAIARNLGAGTEVPLLIQVSEAFNNLTSLTIAVETGPNADLTSSTVIHTETVALADLVAGYVSPQRWLPDVNLDVYLGLRYTVTGSAPTTGKITAALVTERDQG